MRLHIETERLLIRTMVPDDDEAAFLWCGDPKVNAYMIYPLYQSVEQVRHWLEHRDVDHPDTYDEGFVLKETGELIGSGGLVYNRSRDVWQIGYNLRADQWGNGYAVEAMEGILEYVRKTHTVRAIEGEFAVENQKSKRVMEKLGMVYNRDSEYHKFDGSITFQSQVYRKEFND